MKRSHGKNKTAGYWSLEFVVYTIIAIVYCTAARLWGSWSRLVFFSGIDHHIAIRDVHACAAVTFITVPPTLGSLGRAHFVCSRVRDRRNLLTVVRSV
jgi:hypothetical protein